MTELALDDGGISRRVAGAHLTPLGAAPTTPAEVGALRSPRARSWNRRYVALLLGEDALSAVLAIAIGWMARFGVPTDQQFPVSAMFSVVVTLGWLVALQVAGAYHLRGVTTGTQEVRKVLHAAMNVAGALAVLAYLTKLPLTRGFLAIVIPTGLALQILMRFVVRKGVYARRARGEWTSAILAVGTSESVRHLIEATARNPFAGLKVVGACVEDTAVDVDITPGVRVLGGVQDAAEIAERVDADIVAVAGSGLGPRSIRELGWALEGTGRNMVMAPGLTEVAGPRIHVSPVEGLPLMWVDQPQFSGMKRLAKRGMDVLGSLVLLTIGLPFLLAIGLVVRLTSRGPALYKSVRVGTAGQRITMYKFRTMYTGAENLRGGLFEKNEVDGGVIFKMRADPRVTPVGRFLRKFSVDEVPQLLNVLNGSMSLVGPRPPLPDEVERYHHHDHRRMLVKPGMTGLWQVSGRSDLSWDEAVRLDLFYVENWSLALDLAIITRTVWAVLRSSGAY